MTELKQRILHSVQKPARYTGGEFNEIKKNHNIEKVFISSMKNSEREEINNK